MEQKLFQSVYKSNLRVNTKQHKIFIKKTHLFPCATEQFSTWFQQTQNGFTLTEGISTLLFTQQPCWEKHSTIVQMLKDIFNDWHLQWIVCQFEFSIQQIRWHFND